MTSPLPLSLPSSPATSPLSSELYPMHADEIWRPCWVPGILGRDTLAKGPPVPWVRLRLMPSLWSTARKAGGENG